MLLLPSEMPLPCLRDVCDLLHGLDKLSRMSSAVEVLEKQEQAWPKSGRANLDSAMIFMRKAKSVLLVAYRYLKNSVIVPCD